MHDDLTHEVVLPCPVHEVLITLFSFETCCPLCATPLFIITQLVFLYKISHYSHTCAVFIIKSYSLRGMDFSYRTQVMDEGEVAP